MKSVLITFVMFFVIFALLKMNILNVLSNTAFHIISYICFATVIGCAVYFVGIPSRSRELAALNDNSADGKKKEQNNDEK